MAALAALFLLSAAAPAAAQEPADADRDAERAAATEATARPGDRIVDHGISILVPRPGHGTTAIVETFDGRFQELEVVTLRDGSVRLDGFGDDGRGLALLDPARPDPALTGELGDDLRLGVGILASGSGSTSKPAECRDRARDLYGWRTTAYRWRYSVPGTPKRLRQREDGIAQIVAAIKRANRNIVDAFNRCGRADNVSATFEYLGTTRRGTDVSSNTHCGRGDGKSTIGWGSLPGPSIAFTCIHWMVGSSTREADVRISKWERYETKPQWCSGSEFLLEAVMTHEFGHVYGLAHVSAAYDSTQTMQPFIRHCSQAPNTLGKGDMLGLESKY